MSGSGEVEFVRGFPVFLDGFPFGFSFLRLPSGNVAITMNDRR